jgi:hypothetical protein
MVGFSNPQRRAPLLFNSRPPNRSCAAAPSLYEIASLAHASAVLTDWLWLGFDAFLRLLLTLVAQGFRRTCVPHLHRGGAKHDAGGFPPQHPSLPIVAGSYPLTREKVSENWRDCYIY